MKRRFQAIPRENGGWKIVPVSDQPILPNATDLRRGHVSQFLTSPVLPPEAVNIVYGTTDVAPPSKRAKQ